MKIFELFIEIIILVSIAVAFMIIRQLMGFDGILIGLAIIIYLQYKEIKKIKRELSKRNQ